MGPQQGEPRRYSVGKEEFAWNGVRLPKLPATGNENFSATREAEAFLSEFINDGPRRISHEGVLLSDNLSLNLSIAAH